MNREISITASAKINIGLAVGEPLPDGYHPIVSIFQAVSLYDELTIRCDGRLNGIKVAGAFDCLPENTTVYKAAKLFGEQLGEDIAVEISVEKGIPARAGMGGGSSDAAAVLVGLNRLYGNPFEQAQLALLGKGVGADVPYFIAGKGTALVTGIGDIVEPLRTRNDFWIVMVLPDVGIATPWAYAQLDAMRRDVRDALFNSNQFLEAKFRMPKMYYEALRDWDFVNDFQAVVTANFPDLVKVPEVLKSEGAILVALTGSGSGFFGIFESQSQAERASKSMKIPGTQKIMVIKPLETTLKLG